LLLAYDARGGDPESRLASSIDFDGRCEVRIDKDIPFAAAASPLSSVSSVPSTKVAPNNAQVTVDDNSVEDVLKRDSTCPIFRIVAMAKTKPVNAAAAVINDAIRNCQCCKSASMLSTKLAGVLLAEWQAMRSLANGKWL
jgi:hypothetical protein